MHLLHFFTTGDPTRLEDMLPTLVGEKYPVEGLIWNAGEIVE
jgi:hypothetical protein